MFLRVLRGGCLLAIGLAVAGCNLSLPGLSGGDPVREMAVLGGDVVVTGPRDYCVDAKTSRPADGLALIAACSVLTGEGRVPWRNAVMAVQVGADGSALVSGGESELRDFLKTAAGRSLLSVTGTGEEIDVRRVASSTGLVTVIFDDSGAPLIPGTQATEWRGFMDLNGRLVTLGLRGLSADPLSEAAGLSLLRDAISAVKQANTDSP